MKSNSTFLFAEITDIFFPYDTYENKMWINAKFRNASTGGTYRVIEKGGRDLKPL